jgi:glycosyltransferase involved in cell wall biosynthesis
VITNQLHAQPTGGRERLRKLNYEAIRQIYRDQVTLIELTPRRVSNLNEVVDAFRGHIDGISNDAITKVMKTIEDQRIEKKIVEGSNIGESAWLAKKSFPKVQIITFFHNVEARFFAGALRHFKTLHALAVLVANTLAERKSVRYSDKIICLSERDSQLLYKLYRRRATHISAIAVQDTFRNEKINLCLEEEPYALFVGGAFYANRDGIEWFVKQVVPWVEIKTFIIGRGFEELKVKLERNEKVKVVGTVDDLVEWYQKALFVIAPVFDGSGMKTKVAEALMHGKKVIGTPEAFAGYESVVDRAGWVCRTANDFVTAIERAKRLLVNSFDPTVRALYEENYSFAAKKLRLAKILAQ